MKASAKAPSNIAFIKYWGRKDPTINLPNNSTISMNMSNLSTTTTVEFSAKYHDDQIIIDDESLEQESDRAVKHLDRIRNLAKISLKAKVVSKNSFPKSSGLASSASGFAALTLAAAKAAGLDVKKKELSILARLGSGSAARSIPDGFVELKEGHDHKSSYAYSLYPGSFWKINALAVVTSLDKKETGSLDGHKAAYSSPFYIKRLELLEKRILKLKRALSKKDFKSLGEIVEAEALELHSIALTSNPPILYWGPGTIRVMKLCEGLRKQGILCYYTIDAGPQVVVLCLQKDTDKITGELKKLNDVKNIIINSPTKGATLIRDHLF